MPQAIPFIVYAAASYYKIGPILTALAVFTSSLVVANYEQRRAQRAAKRAFEASLRDRQEIIRSSIAPKPIIYGKTVCGGVLTYVAVTGDTKQFCHLVITLASHEITAIDDIYFNDVSIGPLDSNGDVQSGSAYYKVTENAKYENTTVSGQTYTLVETPKAGTLRVTILLNSQGETIELTPDSVAGNVVTISSADASTYSGQSIYFNYQYDEGFPHVHVVKYLGTQTTADSELIADTASLGDGAWTADHIGEGQAYIYIRLKYDTDIFQSGIPQMKFEVRGKKLYDPRTATTAYSNNAALAVYDYLTGADGFGCDASEVNTTLINAAANVCDEDVNISASETQDRYTVNGILSTEDDRLQNLERLLGSMVGDAVWSQGKWNVYAGAYRSPSLTFTEDDLTNTDSITIQSRTPRRDLFNFIKGVYVEPTKSWQATDFSPIGSATYVGYDGNDTITKDVEFQYVTDAFRAQRLATVILQQARLALIVNASFNLKAYNLQPGDTIQLTMARYGFSSKVFRVLERSFSMESGVSLTLKEEDSAAYDWSYTGLVPIVSGEQSNALPTQQGILAPSNLTAVSSNATVKKLPDGTEIPRILVQWTPPADDRVTVGGYIEIEFKESTESVWNTAPRVEGSIARVYIEPVEANRRYDVRIRSVSVTGTKSTWVYAGGVEGQKDTTAPGLPTSVTATAAKQSIVLTWTNPTDLDLNVVEIWVNTSATLIGITKVTEISGERFTHDNLGSNVTRYYYLRAKDHSGNVSDYTSVVSATTQTNLADEIANDIITTAAFASGITPVEIVDTLPSTGNFEGRFVFLTTDNKLYRHTGSAFTKATDGADITANTITAGQIAAGAIGADQIAANAIVADKIAANAVTAAKLVAGDLYAIRIAAGSGGTPGGYKIEITASNVMYVGEFYALDSIFGKDIALLNSVSYTVFDAVNTSASGTGHALRAQNTNASYGSAGLVGPARADFDFYAEGHGAYGPFTGSHDGLILKTQSPDPGDILVDGDVLFRKGVSDATSEVHLSSQDNQPAIGIYVARHEIADGCYIAAAIVAKDEKGNPIPSPEFLALASTHDICGVNAVGEGLINVCGEAGDIAKGDLIVTSSTPGKGMKQGDDIIRSYTVARAREPAVFSGSETKQIACIYLCG
jgi:hypothetical protein